MNKGVDETAALWLQAQARDDMDWESFTAWLEADPTHRAAFDEIALLDGEIDARRGSILAILAANDDAPTIPRSRAARWGAGVAITLLAIAAGGWWLRSPFPPEGGVTTSYVAATGKSRTILLDGDVRITLAAGSRLNVAPGRVLAMSGAGYFDLRHDPQRPVTVSVAGFKVHDLGTRFEINSDGRIVRVAVAEGEVAVMSPKGTTVTVAAGQAVTGDVRSGSFGFTAAGTESIGAWRNGRFVYDQVPLALVAADISRYTGQKVTVDPNIEDKRFSGILAAGDRDAMVASVRLLAGVSVRRKGDAVSLGSGSAGD